MSISVITKDKIDFILANREISEELHTLLNNFIKLEEALNRVLDNIIISEEVDYTKTKLDYKEITKLLREMESMSNGNNARKTKRNSNPKSKTIFKTPSVQSKRRRKGSS